MQAIDIIHDEDFTTENAEYRLSHLTTGDIRYSRIQGTPYTGRIEHVGIFTQDDDGTYWWGIHPLGDDLHAAAIAAHAHEHLLGDLHHATAAFLTGVPADPMLMGRVRDEQARYTEGRR